MATRRRGRKRASTSGHGVILLLPRTSVTENRKSSPTKSRSYLSKGVRNLFPQSQSPPRTPGKTLAIPTNQVNPWGWEHEERRGEGEPRSHRRQTPSRVRTFLNVAFYAATPLLCVVHPLPFSV